MYVYLLKIIINRLTQYFYGVDEIPLRAVPDLASIVPLIGVSDVLQLQVVADKGYPRVHAD